MISRAGGGRSGTILPFSTFWNHVFPELGNGARPCFATESSRGNASTIPHPIYAGHYYAGSMQSVVPKENWTRWKTGLIAFAKDKAITDITQSVIY